MLLKHIFTTCALALGVLSAPSNPMDSNLESTRSDDPNEGPVILGTFTGLECAQIEQAHLDAVELCRTATTNSTDFLGRFDHVFLNYFNPADRDLVISKSAALQSRTPNQSTNGIQMCSTRSSGTEPYSATESSTRSPS